MEAGKSKICRVSGQARDSGKSWCCSLSPKVDCWQNFLFLSGGQPFPYDLQLIGWVPFTLWHIILTITEANLLYSVYDLNVNLFFKNTFAAISRHLWPNIWVPGPSQGAHKINHCRDHILKISYISNPGLGLGDTKLMTHSLSSRNLWSTITLVLSFHNKITDSIAGSMLCFLFSVIWDIPCTKVQLQVCLAAFSREGTGI